MTEKHTHHIPGPSLIFPIVLNNTNKNRWWYTQQLIYADLLNKNDRYLSNKKTR